MTTETPAASVDWMSQGACRTEDPELFFPISLTGPAVHQVSMAKAVCRRCGVQASCRSYAVSTGQDGVWGGTTRDERMAMRVPSAALAARLRDDAPTDLASAEAPPRARSLADPQPGGGMG